MAAYRRVYDSRHLQADCQVPGSAPEPYALQSSMGNLYLYAHLHRYNLEERGSEVRQIEYRSSCFDIEGEVRNACSQLLGTTDSAPSSAGKRLIETSSKRCSRVGTQMPRERIRLSRIRLGLRFNRIGVADVFS